MSKAQKIQQLLISHLLEQGHIELALPDGMKVELGILKEKRGELCMADGYSWAIVSQKEREVSIDSFNFGLRYYPQNGKMIVEDSTEDQEGRPVQILTAV